LGSGEQSRFIKQLKSELPRLNPKIQIEESILEIPYKKIEDHPISIDKTPEIIDKLKAKANSGFSPSVLNSYIQCSLKFYFEQILGLWEKDEVEEEIDAKTYGTVLHDVLRILYEPYLNRVLRIEDIKGMQDNAEIILRDTFGRKFKGSDLNYGKNLLKIKIAEIMINDFLKSEINDIRKNRSEIIIKYLEKTLYSEIKIDDPAEEGKDMIVKLKGTVDRIDLYNSIHRVSDYKTGKVDTYKLNIKDFEELRFDNSFAQSFQLLMYSYLFMKNNGKSGNDLHAGIFALKNAKDGLKKVSFQKEASIDNEVMMEFSTILQQILLEIFNRDQAFEQTADPERCAYCNFVNICNRWNPRRTI